MASFKHTIQNFLTEHRGWVVLFTALPLSFLFDKYFTFRNWIYRSFIASNKLHEKRVAGVQEQVRRWNASGREKMMCTARKPWLNMSPRTATFKKNCNQIEINLRDILEIDTRRQIVRAEPRRGHGIHYPLPASERMGTRDPGGDGRPDGWRTLLGLGMETNCHRYGLIQETVEAYEVITADGSLVRATRTENADLFYALPWSWGTIAFLVAVELKIIPVKPYMHIKYIPCHSQEEYCKKMQELSVADDTPGFLEATVYAKDKAVIMCGEFAEVSTREQRGKINPINRWYKPWYYKHVEKCLESGPFDEYIPLRHYYHRYTRSIFWELRELIPFGNHPVYRYLLGWLGAPKVSFLKFTMNKGVRRKLIYKHVVQDIIIPISVMSEAIDLFHDLFEIYPLLVFPIRIYDNGEHQGMLRKPVNSDTRKELGNVL